MLVEDDSKSKAKSLTTGLAYQSLLSSLLRSCPDLLPECPFHWLSAVFQSKRQKVELNKEEPTYNVRYLGSVVTVLAKGEGCTHDAVAKIWASSNYGEQSAKMKLSVGPYGVHMGARRKPVHLYTLNRITYCTTDPHQPKIFAWVYRHQVRHKAVVLRCHAVLLAKAEKARAIALSLYQNSVSAFSEFKRLKRQSDFRHRKQELLGEDIMPMMPLRKLLNGQCRYRPPFDRPGNSSCLFSITEEEEEEVEDQKRNKEEINTGPEPTNVDLEYAENELGYILDGLDGFSITIRDEVHMTLSTLV